MSALDEDGRAAAPQQHVTQEAPQTSYGPVERLDRLRTTRSHVVWVGVLGLGYLVETFDNTVFGYLAPSIRSYWNLSLGSVGVITSAVFYGMMAGAVVGGRLLDRFGRRPVLIWASVFYSLTSLFCALAPGFSALFVGRVLTGFGVQAATGAVLVYASEMFPRLARGRVYTSLILFGAVGAPVSSFTAAAIAPSSAGAWRFVFALGVVGVLIAVVAARWLPESVRWLTLHGREALAERTVERLEAQDRRRGPLAAVMPMPAQIAQGSFRELFKPRYARRLVVVTLTFAGALYCQYGFTAYLATILVGSGMSKKEALDSAAVITLGAIFVVPFLFFVADRIERKTAILVESVISAVGLVAFGNAHATSVVIATGLLTYMGIAGLIISFYNFIPENFPTEVRGVGTGIVNGVGRVAGIVASLTVVALYASFGVATLYLVLAIVVIVVGLGAFLLGARTTGRALETISPEVG